MESNCFLVIYLVAWSNLSQYIVSDVSFSAIPIFEMKSFWLCVSIASLTLAPMLVPLGSICFERTYSLLLFIR